MKRLIRRQQVIDCGAETCGKCRFRHVDNGYWRCWFWDYEHLENHGRKVFRCYQCKNAEVKEK